MAKQCWEFTVRVTHHHGDVAKERATQLNRMLVEGVKRLKVFTGTMQITPVRRVEVQHTTKLGERLARERTTELLGRVPHVMGEPDSKPKKPNTSAWEGEKVSTDGH